MEIQEEVKNLREENERLRKNQAALIDENKRSEERDDLAKFRREYIDVADRIFVNFRNQIDMCHRVREIILNHFTQYPVLCYSLART